MNSTAFHQIMSQAAFDMKAYGESAKPGYYPYIQYSGNYELYEMFRKYARKDDNFVDVGSGIGDKLYVASLAADRKFKSITGIEVNKETFYVSKYLINRLRREGKIRANTRLELTDALNVDYSRFSFIYMFHPIRNKKIYKRLIERIKDTSLDGTILFELLHYPYGEESITNNPSDKVFLIKNGSEFEDIPGAQEYYKNVYEHDLA